MKAFALFLFMVGFTLGINAQNYQTIEDVNEACAQLGFTSNEDAEIAVDRILDAVGLFRNFVIQECPDINNAVAKVIEISDNYKERYILFDGNFFESMNSKANTDWAAMSILAHEIGHHLNGHALNDIGSNHRFELEADFFSGSALAKLGASLEQAQSAIMTLRYEKATHTHPAKADRLKAIESGWRKSTSGKKVAVEIANDDVILVFPENPEQVTYYYDLAIKAQENEQYVLAAGYLVSAFQHSGGKNFNYLYHAGNSFVNAKDYENALKQYLAIVRTGVETLAVEDQTILYKNIALIYVMQHRENEALQFFDFALRKNPQNIEILTGRANLYYTIGDVVAFKKALQHILKVDPNNVDALFNTGVMESQSGNTELAVDVYNRVLAIDPNHENTLINIAVIILNRELSNIEEMNSLGTSKQDDIRYEKLKEDRKNIMREALVYLERIIHLDSKNMDVLNTTANIYNVLGDTDNYNRIQNMKR